jgi:hypothetical protein
MDPKEILMKIPRRGLTLVEAIQQQAEQWRRTYELQRREVEIYQFFSLEDIAERCPVGTISLLATPSLEGAAPISELKPTECVVLGRFAVSDLEVAPLVNAVNEGRVVIGVEAVPHHLYPLLRIVLVIYDRPRDPLISEGLADIANADLQEYLQLLASASSQLLSIHNADGRVVVQRRIRAGLRFYEYFASAFLKTASLYGNQLRPMEAFLAASQEFMQLHPTPKLPPTWVKVELYESGEGETGKK